jgi:hypothetical protein
MLLRNIEKSVRHQVVTLLTNPPVGTFTNPFNCYGEDSFNDDTFVPKFPFVWVMSVRVPPKKTRLPMILIERAPAISSLFELGNRSGTYVTVNIHIFGRNRGERSDLASFLYEHMTILPLYDFTTEPATLLYTVSIDRRTSATQSISPDIGAEGALNNWETVSLDFQLQ